jgi:hypothetical protein
VQAATMSKDELRDIRKKVETGQKTEAVVITREELERMKGSTKTQTKEQESQQKRLLEEQKDQQLAAAKARKAKMLLLDKDRKNKMPDNEQQVLDKDKTETLLTKAQQMMDEEHDDVKHMNQMMLYSKVVTIRDRQKEEQKLLELEWVDEQKRLDLMMEIERLKSLQLQEEREVARKHAQIQGAAVIVDQIRERELERIKVQEMREREMLQMLRQTEQLKVEESKVTEAKKVRAARLMVEVEEANRRAMDSKEYKKLEEKSEEMKIVEYNRQKAMREGEQQAELQRVKEEKEKDVQRLREMQEKAADRQSEIDALRAKRAFEESERLARDKERTELQKKQDVLAEMEEARQRQFMDRERRLAEQAKQERDEFLRIINKQKEIEEQEKRIEEEKKGVMKKHSTQIRGQIQQNEEKGKQDRLDYLEEGKKVRQKIDDERKKIEAIKAKKLGQLTGLDIP